MQANRGFTLIEILVAIAIASLLLLGIYGVFGGLSSARNQIEASGAAYHQARVLFDRISRELRSLVPPNATSLTLRGGTDQRGRTYLEMTSSAATPLGGAPGGTVMIRYLQSEDETPGSTEQALYRLERPWWGADDDQLGQRLIAAVAEFNLRFYDGNQWLDAWAASAGNLPAAIEIGLVLVNGDERVPFRSSFDLPLLVTP